MKILTVVRHARSSHAQAGLTDSERPLNERGRREAPDMGRRLADRGATADRIISSPAERARATAEIIAGAIGYPPASIHIDARLYDGDADGLLHVVQELDDALVRVMLCGHNPDVTELVHGFSIAPVGNLPTCGVVELWLAADRWRDVGPATAAEVVFDHPRRSPAP